MGRSGPRRVAPLIGAALALALAVAGCSGTGNASDPGPAPDEMTTIVTSTSAPPASMTIAGVGPLAVCAAGDLTLSFGTLQNAVGYGYQEIVFTNTGPHSCVMAGFPTVSYAVDNGSQVGTTATKDGAEGGAVVLHHGGVAAAMVVIADPGMFPTDLCQPTAVDGLRVIPPGAVAAMYLARPGLACGITPPSPQLRVQTVRSGTGGS
ncbi:MAG TPA: DUF4232 domain-containing protein [Pseudonocardiaceae bacterium]|jgi:hypothetical protein|nr:DUF4232 domain-containing protein [Pseudonocardiaceae bacterium]